MNEELQEPQLPTLPLSSVQKFLYGVIVIVAPIFNFTFVELMKPDWQDGKLSSYIGIFLLPEASLFFFPLLAYAVISYIQLLWDTDRYARSFITRLGIYTGVFLALQYSLLTLLAMENQPDYLLLLVYASPFILAKGYRWLTSRLNASLVNGILIGVGIIALVAGMIVMETPISPFFLIMLFVGVSAAFWSFLIALQTSRWLWTHYENQFTLPRGLGLFAWLSAYIFALRFNIVKMYELYAALPPEPPNCYIATAAANGHPRFVGSQEVTLASGKSMRVNRQLQRLKALEIAWMGASDPSHRMMRRVYDVIGKRLATHIRHPIVADVVYLSLKPFEFLTILLLKLIFKDVEELTSKIYRKNGVLS